MAITCLRLTSTKTYSTGRHPSIVSKAIIIRGELKKILWFPFRNLQCRHNPLHSSSINHTNGLQQIGQLSSTHSSHRQILFCSVYLENCLCHLAGGFDELLAAGRVACEMIRYYYCHHDEPVYRHCKLIRQPSSIKPLDGAVQTLQNFYSTRLRMWDCRLTPNGIVIMRSQLKHLSE